MQRKTHRLVQFILALFALMAAAQANAQTVGNGPYYATPSWDQKLQCDTLSTCLRFVVLANWNNEAVLDRETGLVWVRQPYTSKANWSAAKFVCRENSWGRRYGWRLPSLQELQSLSGNEVVGGSLNLPPGHPFIDAGGAQQIFWSATTFFNDPDVAYTVEFAFSGGVSINTKSVQNRYWCVRGGSGQDTQ